MKALNLIRFAIVGACAAMAVACESAPLPSPDQISRAPATGAMDGYRLGTGDEIKVTVFDEPTLSGPVTVDGLGTITLSLAGQVQVKDLTLPEAERAIEAKYRDGKILKNPRVTADMVKGRPYYILGEVNKAGEYPFTSGLTVMNAVAAAGDFTYRADKRKVMVTGASDGVEREVTLTPTTPVHPGDRIRVRERLF